jgi:hypothetical protein
MGFEFRLLAGDDDLDVNKKKRGDVFTLRQKRQQQQQRLI